MATDCNTCSWMTSCIRTGDVILDQLTIGTRVVDSSVVSILHLLGLRTVPCVPKWCPLTREGHTLKCLE